MTSSILPYCVLAGDIFGEKSAVCAVDNVLLPRLDRKIEFPAPTEEARARIMQIHARKMNVDPDVNYEELARC